MHAESHSDSELHLRGILTDSECMDGGRTIVQPTVHVILMAGLASDGDGELHARCMRAWFVSELCELRTFGSPQMSLVSSAPKSVPAFLGTDLGASIEFPVILKRAQ